MKNKDFGRLISDISLNVSAAREKRGLTQLMLAEKMGVSVQMIQYWERGANITVKTLFKLSRVLQCPLVYFFKKPTKKRNRRGRPKVK